MFSSGRDEKDAGQGRRHALRWVRQFHPAQSVDPGWHQQDRGQPRQ